MSGIAKVTGHSTSQAMDGSYAVNFNRDSRIVMKGSKEDIQRGQSL